MNWFTVKDPDAEEDWGQEEKGMSEDEMVGWHHWLNGHYFEQALDDGEGQGGLVCCSPWGHKELDIIERLNNNNEVKYIMQNAGLDEAQAGIKIVGRNINNFRNTYDTTLMTESEEELKSLLMKEESEKVDLKFNIQKTKIMASGPITSWEIDGKIVETGSDFILGGF